MATTSECTKLYARIAKIAELNTDGEDSGEDYGKSILDLFSKQTHEEVRRDIAKSRLARVSAQGANTAAPMVGLSQYAAEAAAAVGPISAAPTPVNEVPRADANLEAQQVLGEHFFSRQTTEQPPLDILLGAGVRQKPPALAFEGVAQELPPAASVAEARLHASTAPPELRLSVTASANSGASAENRFGSTAPEEPAAPEVSATFSKDSDPAGTIQRCWAVCQRLRSKEPLTDRERLNMMQESLAAILSDNQATEITLCEVCQRLQRADPDAYRVEAQAMMQRGFQYLVMTKGTTTRNVTNLVMIQRPQMTLELGLTRIVDLALLDSAFAELAKYVMVTAEVNAAHAADNTTHGFKLAAAHARTVASAQSSLRTYLNTLEFLSSRNRQTQRVLNVHAGGNVAVQVNEAGAPPNRVGEA